jgi:hypothetical protein
METSLKYSQAGEREHEQQRGFLTLLNTFFATKLKFMSRTLFVRTKTNWQHP